MKGTKVEYWGVIRGAWYPTSYNLSWMIYADFINFIRVLSRYHKTVECGQRLLFSQLFLLCYTFRCLTAYLGLCPERTKKSYQAKRQKCSTTTILLRFEPTCLHSFYSPFWDGNRSPSPCAILPDSKIGRSC